jgi:hypothetical protein
MSCVIVLGFAACVEPVPYEEPFIVGVNLPWWSYGGDVGSTSWGHLGASTRVDEVDATFAELEQAGVHEVRWFAFGDGRASPEFDGDLVTGLEDVAFDDFDTVFDAATAHDVRVLVVLFDYLICSPRSVVDGVSLGGRHELVMDSAARRSLMETVIVPLAETYADHPGIAGWEVINEPEWAMRGRLGLEETGDGPMTDFVSDVAEALFLHSDAPVSVGSTDMRSARDLWVDAPLDAVSVHWYGVSLPAPLDLSDDRPVYLGEFSADRDVGGVMGRAQDAGYTGAFPWSLNADDGHGPLDLGELTEWTQR